MSINAALGFKCNLPKSESDGGEKIDFKLRDRTRKRKKEIIDTEPLPKFATVSISVERDLLRELDKFKKVKFYSSKQLMESMVDYCVREWLRENDPEWAANNPVEAVEEEEAGNGTKEDLH